MPANRIASSPVLGPKPFKLFEVRALLPKSKGVELTKHVGVVGVVGVVGMVGVVEVVGAVMGPGPDEVVSAHVGTNEESPENMKLRPPRPKPNVKRTLKL
mmetsp:Transcript_37633/g.68079  ORF Transcript_37633/g.68079 Transcript_37633/m.68079 type:complete len:100 (+) Transcript_37633:661-960(+)